MKRQPNILMIMVDQMRADWMSCAGTSYVDTPNIDRIAEKGVRFSRAACNGPICVPSRISMTSGLYTHRTGALENYVNYPLDQPTFYQALRKNGYRVGVVGKTDLHKYDMTYGEDGDNPLMYHLGFTDVHETIGKMAVHFYDKPAVNCPYKKYLAQKDLVSPLAAEYKKRIHYLPGGAPIWYSGVSPLPAEDNHESYIGRKACEFLSGISDIAPWHLFISFVGPHDPWDAPQEYYDKFKDKEFPSSISLKAEGKPEWIKKRSGKFSKSMAESDLQEVKKHYAGMITLIDDWVGKILDTLDERNMSDETVVIFCSDHGEMMGDHGLFHKTAMYEPSLRVPLIIADPGAGRKSVVDDSLVELVDIYPTLLELGDTDYDGSRLDGTSLVPLLNDETVVHKEYQLAELENTRMLLTEDISIFTTTTTGMNFTISNKIRRKAGI